MKGCCVTYYLTIFTLNLLKQIKALFMPCKHQRWLGNKAQQASFRRGFLPCMQRLPMIQLIFTLYHSATTCFSAFSVVYGL